MKPYQFLVFVFIIALGFLSLDYIFYNRAHSNAVVPCEVTTEYMGAKLVKI